MVRIQVLAQHNLKTRSRTSPCDDDCRSKKILPNPKPSNTIIGHDFFLVGSPIPVPSPECGRIMDANIINRNNSKPPPSKEVTVQPNGVRASAPGKIYLLINKPQQRSSYFHGFRKQGYCRTNKPSSSSKS